MKSTLSRALAAAKLGAVHELGTREGARAFSLEEGARAFSLEEERIMLVRSVHALFIMRSEPAQSEPAHERCENSAV